LEIYLRVLYVGRVIFGDLLVLNKAQRDVAPDDRIVHQRVIFEQIGTDRKKPEASMLIPGLRLGLKASILQGAA
jgi:hypothetical protein